LTAVCQAQTVARGTLVAVIPANSGVAVAADSRTTGDNEGAYCDGRAKLFVPSKRKSTVVFATGTPSLFPNFDGIVAANSKDYCAFLKSTKPMLDLSTFLMNDVDEKLGQVLTQAETKKIANDCAAQVTAFSNKHKATHPLKNFRGKGMFTGVIVSYDAKRGVGLIGHFDVSVDTTETAVVKTISWKEFLKSDEIHSDWMLFGEGAYANENAAKYAPELLGPFKAILGQSVSRTSMNEAADAVLSLIKATEKAAKIVKPMYSIGGPIDVATISKSGAVINRY
jgi:hypothetical protein